MSQTPLNDLLNYINTIHEENESMFKTFVGDFNFTSTNKNLLTDWMEHNNYIQYVTKPTHILGNTLDHVYTNTSTKYKLNVTSTPVYFSDHVLLNMQLK